MNLIYPSISEKNSDSLNKLKTLSNYVFQVFVNSVLFWLQRDFFFLDLIRIIFLVKPRHGTRSLKSFPKKIAKKNIFFFSTIFFRKNSNVRKLKIKFSFISESRDIINGFQSWQYCEETLQRTRNYLPFLYSFVTF